MKVLFSVLNSKYIHSSLAPWCLFTSCREYCTEDASFGVYESTINENQQKVLSELENENADVYAFSCYIWNIGKTLELCRKIKETRPEKIILLGGPEVAYNQKQILEENLFVDFVASGEGEDFLPAFFDSLSRGETYFPEGVSFREKGEAIVSSASVKGERVYPSPYCAEYFQSLKGRIAYIEASRGCPFSCAFCLSGRCGKTRFFPLERIKNEMLMLCENGAKIVKFVDRTFNCNKQRAYDILSFIKENHGSKIPADVCFHFEIAADLLNDKLLELIASLPMGAVQFEVGIQSFNENTLALINRKTDISLVEKNLTQLIKGANCHVHIDLIAGLPQEDIQSFVKGFNRAYEIKANMLQLGFLKILHGSPMDENPDIYPCAYSKEPPYEVISTPFISQSELEKLHIAENELERLYNSSRFSRTLEYVLSAAELTPFELFLSFGRYLSQRDEKGSIPLDRYTCLAFDFFSSLERIDRAKLRDVMIYDRIATNNSGVIPERLKVKDSNLKKIRNAVAEKHPLKKGTLRCLAVLYSEKKIIFSDYGERNSITGEYKVTVLPLEQ